MNKTGILYCGERQKGEKRVRDIERYKQLAGIVHNFAAFRIAAVFNPCAGGLPGDGKTFWRVRMQLLQYRTFAYYEIDADAVFTGFAGRHVCLRLILSDDGTDPETGNAVVKLHIMMSDPNRKNDVDIIENYKSFTVDEQPEMIYDKDDPDYNPYLDRTRPFMYCPDGIYRRKEARPLFYDNDKLL